jgi:hypothetical protein
MNTGLLLQKILHLCFQAMTCCLSCNKNSAICHEAKTICKQFSTHTWTTLEQTIGHNI